MNNNDLLYDLYYNKLNFDGANKLWMKAKDINNKIKLIEVKNWLKEQATYQLNYNDTKKKNFLPIYSEVPYSYQIDLTFLPKYKSKNDNNYVLFTAIGINTRYAYASYSKDKKTETILNMFKDFKKEVKFVNSIDGDKGSEFINKKFIKYLDDNEIQHDFYKSDSHKLGIINRFHRTLKNKLTKYMISKDTVKWIDVLDTIIKNYNNTYHRGIQTKPKNLFNNFLNESILIEQKRDETNEIKTNEIIFNINDKIRHKLNKVLFEDKMSNKYSYEIYIVKQIKNNTLIVEDSNKHKHTFKKSMVMKVDKIDNIKPNVNITKDKKANKIIRLLEKENLINEPRENRTRINPNKKKNEDYIYN